MNAWLVTWDYLDEVFWGYCRQFARELTPDQLAWRPSPTIASIGWNLWHLGEMLDHYLTHVFRARPATVSAEPLVTMAPGAPDDGRFGDLAAIADYHRHLRPAFRGFLASLRAEDLDRPLLPHPGARSVGWAVGHIIEHEGYHRGKCTLLRNLILGRSSRS